MTLVSEPLEQESDRPADSDVLLDRDVAEGEPPDADRPEPAPEDEAAMKRIKDLPPEVGVMLLTVGALGFVLPGVVGAPAAIAGGLVLWPKRFAPIESWLERRFPQLHKQSLQQINRYLDDLEGRYPIKD